jgi:hypothetical protein
MFETSVMPSPFVFVPGERLSEAELTAACLDGHVVALGEAYIPADVVESAALRGATLAPLLGATLAATHLSAVWVHGGIDEPPARHTVQRAVPRRLHHVMGRRFSYRDTELPRADLDVVGGVAITTVARTAADLARLGDIPATRALREWDARAPDVAAAGMAWLDAHPRLPFGTRARRLLGSLRTT